jgi:hypothetical protein
MRVPFSRLPLSIVLLVIFTALNTSCSKNYDLVSDYVVLEEIQVSMDTDPEVEDTSVADKTKSETQHSSAISTP